jgi:hypothetical protein
MSSLPDSRRRKVASLSHCEVSPSKKGNFKTKQPDPLFVEATQTGEFCALVVKKDHPQESGFIHPFLNLMENDSTLRANCRIHQICTRAHANNPNERLKYTTSGKNRVFEWKALICILEDPMEENNAHNREEWGTILAKAIDRVAHSNLFAYENSFAYGGDLTHTPPRCLGEIIQVDDTFDIIKKSFVDDNLTDENILDDNKLMHDYFGPIAGPKVRAARPPNLTTHTDTHPTDQRPPHNNDHGSYLQQELAEIFQSHQGFKKTSQLTPLPDSLPDK